MFDPSEPLILDTAGHPVVTELIQWFYDCASYLWDVLVKLLLLL